MRQIRPEFAALRAERESLGRHLELWLKVGMAQAPLNRDEAAPQLTDRVAPALSVLSPACSCISESFNALTLHDEISQAWTADRPQPDWPETREFAAFLAGISDSTLAFRNLDVLREEDL